jgi:nucleotide-binding universal stress UspA family protein
VTASDGGMTMSFDFFLPLLTYPDPTPLAGLLHAVDLASTLGGTVSVRAQVVDIPPITNPLATTIVDYSALASAAEAKSQKVGEELIRHVSNLCERFQLPVETGTLTAGAVDLGATLAAAARTHDITLCVLDAECMDHRAAAEALLFESGGPVVLFPATEAATHIQTVTIAWDGSRASARAVRDALPILELAEHVAIVTVREDKVIPLDTVEGLRSLLASHDITATHHDVPLDGKPIGEVIQNAALSHDTGLLVMGAYGHNRLREFILGGATRTVLRGMRLPTLMSH